MLVLDLDLDLEMPALVLAERMDFVGRVWDGGEGSRSIFAVAEVEVVVGVLRFFFAAIVIGEVA